MSSKIQDEGSPDSKIMIVGECPTKKDEALGYPFGGATGKLLKSMLKHSGINYSNCFVIFSISKRLTSSAGVVLIPSRFTSRSM